MRTVAVPTPTKDVLIPRGGVDERHRRPRNGGAVLGSPSASAVCRFRLVWLAIGDSCFGRLRTWP